MYIGYLIVICVQRIRSISPLYVDRSYVVEMLSIFRLAYAVYSIDELFIRRCEIGHTHLDIIEDCDSFHDGAIRGLLIVLGLSVHELFEGLAIGLESSAQYVW